MSIIKFLLIIIILLLFNELIAQEKIIRGQAEIPELDPNVTKLNYEHEAYKEAVNNALNKAFGTIVSSNYERLMGTVMEGRSVKDHIDIRNHYINTYPNGIWIRDKEKPKYTEVKDEKGTIWMKCEVIGYAEEIKGTAPEFIAKTLDGTNIELNETEHFSDKERGYLYFKSAESGYIIIFYDDFSSNVQRLIPYNRMPRHDLRIDANKDYIFFSVNHADYIEDKTIVDEIEFEAIRILDYNQFYILFSPTPFDGYFLDPGKDLPDGYSTFKSMDRVRFHNWLQKLRKRKDDLQVQIIGITIKK